MQPGGLGPGDGDEAKALHLARGQRQGPRFLQQRVGFLLAAPRLQQAKHRERRNPADRRRARVMEHGLGIRHRLRPVAKIERHARAQRRHIANPGIEIVFLAEGDAVGETGHAPRQIAHADVTGCKIGVGPRRLFAELFPEGEVEAVFQFLSAAEIALGKLGGADIVERVTENFQFVELGRKGDGLRPPFQRQRGFIGQHVELRAIAVRHGKLRPRRQRLQRRDRVTRILLGSGLLTVEPGKARQPAEIVAFLQPVADLLPQCQRRLARGDRLGGAVDDVTFVGEFLVQDGAFGGRQHCRIPQRRLVMRGGFAMRT